MLAMNLAGIARHAMFYVVNPVEQLLDKFGPQ